MFITAQERGKDLPAFFQETNKTSQTNKPKQTKPQHNQTKITQRKPPPKKTKQQQQKPNPKQNQTQPTSKKNPNPANLLPLLNPHSRGLVSVHLRGCLDSLCIKALIKFMLIFKCTVEF